MAWSNYPQAATNAAKKALKHRDENGSDCGTPVGWQRANQLAKREAISDEVLRRTYSFLSRAKVYDQGKFFDADGKEICGSVMYAAWGGNPMLRWAKKTIEQMEDDKRHIKSVIETEDEIVITFGKGESADADYKEEEEEKAAPNELSIGDFVTWKAGDSSAYGRVIQIKRDGDLEADSGYAVEGTEEDPVAKIRVYRYDSEEDAYVERQPALNVVHKFSTLKSHNAEVRKQSTIVEKREFRMERVDYEGETVRGYAAVYNSDSEWMGGFYEQISAGAFDDVMDNDVRAYFNHNENLLLGRVSSGTLRIGTDKKGLWYEVDLPDTSYARDLVELMKRGDVDQSSFAFLIDEDKWEERDGKTYRIITKVSRLLDVSPVAQPAYPEATSGLVSRNDKPESEGAKANSEKNDDEAENDVSVFEYKLKLLNLDS